VYALRNLSSSAAKSLDSLRLKRHKADYSIGEDISIREVEISLIYSRSVLRELGMLPADSPPHNKPYPHDYLDSGKFLSNKY